MQIKAWVLLAIACSFSDVSQAALTYQSDILPILTEYCYGCHGHGKQKGDVALDKATAADEKLWDRVLNVLERGEMPPANKPQPSSAQRHLITQ